MQNLVKDIQDMWLGTWRSLFIGKYADEDVENLTVCKVQEFLSKEYVTKINTLMSLYLFYKCYRNLNVTQKVRHVFNSLVKGCSYLTLNELKLGVKYCFPNASKSVQLSVFNFMRKCNDDLNLHEIKRQPVIFIIDEVRK